jgi:hypothetical protein
MSTYRKVTLGTAANVYRPAAEVYQQDELPPCNKGELRGVNKAGGRVIRAAVALPHGTEVKYSRR